MEDAATAARDADSSDSIASEQAGDRAKQDGDLLFALVHYRNAAEHRADDSRLAAKIEETVAARLRAAPKRTTPVATSSRRPSNASFATLIVAGILTAGNVLTVTRFGNVEKSAVASAAPSTASDNLACAVDSGGWTPLPVVESSVCPAAETSSGYQAPHSRRAHHKAHRRSRLARARAKATKQPELRTKKARPARFELATLRSVD